MAITVNCQLSIAKVGLFDFFKKKSKITVEMRQGNVFVNGTALGMSPSVEQLTGLFGQKPRKIDAPNDRINFAWDNLGLYCYTDNGGPVTCVGIRLNEGEKAYGHFPAGLFSGEVTVLGKPWFAAANSSAAGDTGMFKVINLGGYSATFSYDDEMRSEKDCTEIEITFHEFDFGMIM